MRTYVYVDGFNLYYGALKGTPYKWLDIRALFRAILRPENDILKIRYYTARVSSRPDNPDAPTRQDFYLQALQAHIAELQITEGHCRSDENRKEGTPQIGGTDRSGRSSGKTGFRSVAPMGEQDDPYSARNTGGLPAP